jgi:hypothetical protein
MKPHTSAGVASAVLGLADEVIKWRLAESRLANDPRGRVWQQTA